MTWKLQEPRENIAHVFRLFIRSPRRGKHASEGKPFVLSRSPASRWWRCSCSPRPRQRNGASVSVVGGEHESSWRMSSGHRRRCPQADRQNNLELNPRFSWFLREDMTRFQLDVNALSALT